MSQATGNAFMAAGRGLRGIGRLVAGQREDEEERRIRDEDRARSINGENIQLAQWLDGRGGALGPAPRDTPKPAAPAAVPEGPGAGRIPGSSVSAGAVPALTTTTPMPSSDKGPPTQRYAELPGGMGHFVRSDVRQAEERKQGIVDQSAERQQLYDSMSGLTHIPEPSRRAIASGVPASLAIPAARRGAGGAGGGAPRITVPQAMDEVRRQYGRWDPQINDYVYRDATGRTKPFSEMYAEAVQMARGGGMAPDAGAAAPAATGGPSADLVGRLNGGTGPSLPIMGSGVSTPNDPGNAGAVIRDTQGRAGRGRALGELDPRYAPPSASVVTPGGPTVDAVVPPAGSGPAPSGPPAPTPGPALPSVDLIRARAGRPMRGPVDPNPRPVAAAAPPMRGISRVAGPARTSQPPMAATGGSPTDPFSPAPRGAPAAASSAPAAQAAPVGPFRAPPRAQPAAGFDLTPRVAPKQPDARLTEARQLAQQLKREGRSDDEILQIMNDRGFSVTR